MFLQMNLIANNITIVVITHLICLFDHFYGMAGWAEEEVDGGLLPILEAGAVVTPATQHTFLWAKGFQPNSNIIPKVCPNLPASYSPPFGHHSFGTFHQFSPLAGIFGSYSQVLWPHEYTCRTRKD